MSRTLIFSVLMFLSCLLMLLGGCGGGGGSSTGDAPLVGVMGIDLPTEVSAVPADTGSPVPTSLASSIRKLAVSLPADSDYTTTRTARFVDEPTLEVFGIIETILNAVAQTHYADPANVGAGPYKTIVSWFEENDGKSEKTLETWIVDSTMPNATTNVVKIWIDDPMEPVKVRATITQSPTQNTDGDYLDYGKWSIQANIGTGSGFGGTFYAEADINAGSGETILRLTESFAEPSDVPDGQGGSAQITITNDTRAIMYKDQGTGYGHAALADREYCWQGTQQGGASACYTGAVNGAFTIPQDEVLYGYNATYLGLQQVDNLGNLGTPTYKDRTALTEIAYRYGLFDATTGQNVEKIKTFGFPVTFEATNGQTTYTNYGYYGAWQGRHQLWAGPNGSLPDGTVVTEEVWDNSTPASFTTKTFASSLTRRNLMPADISQITDIPLEIYLGDGYEMQYDANGAVWNKCGWDPQANGGFGDYLCDGSFGTVTPATDLVAPANTRKDVNLNSCDQQGSCFELAYDVQGGGFVEVSFGQNGPVYGNSWTPQNLDRVWVWIGGQTYIAFDGSSWVEKELLSFDEQTWTPTFGSNDTPFTFQLGDEYYINNKGVNFVVAKIAENGTAADFEVEMELQKVATPRNTAAGATTPFFPAGVSYLAYPWDSQQKFVLDTNSASQTYMMLVYAPGQALEGQLVEQSGWGLQAYDSQGQGILNGQEPIQFNYEFAGNGDWGALTYLIDASNQFVYLDDPIQFDPIDLAVGPSGNQTTVSFSLEFDGWLHGLPDMRWELEKNGFQITPQLASKVVNIPAGTAVTDSLTATGYLIKPLEVGVILNPATPTGGTEPTIPATGDVPLDSFSVPAWVDIGSKPTGLTTKYIEGKAATPN